MTRTDIWYQEMTALRLRMKAVAREMDAAAAKRQRSDLEPVGAIVPRAVLAAGRSQSGQQEERRAVAPAMRESA